MGAAAVWTGEFLAQVNAGDRAGRLPAFVQKEFEAYRDSP
jgi:hypothetical protein